MQASLTHHSVSVKEAMERGERQITYPCIVITTTFLAGGTLLPLFGFSWWCLMLFPIGILLSFCYTQLATHIWSTWAYQYVNDVHQFQRSGELAGFFKRGDYERDYPGLAEPHSFVDDDAIPRQTTIYEKSLFGISRWPMLILSDAGIRWNDAGLLPWDEIRDERIAKVGFKSVNGRGITTHHSEDYFRLQHGNERYELAMSVLAISVWELDLLLYIYRGRWAQKGIAPVRLMQEAN